MHKNLLTFDSWFIEKLRQWGVPALRISLGMVFVWFGFLKVLGVSPVVPLIASTFPFLPTHTFVLLLGIVEVAIGLGLIFKMFLRATLFLLWLQMLGTLSSFFFNPELFFVKTNPLFLTMEGEFIMKNFVLISAGLVIGGTDVKPLAQLKS